MNNSDVVAERNKDLPKDSTVEWVLDESGAVVLRFTVEEQVRQASAAAVQAAEDEKALEAILEAEKQWEAEQKAEADRFYQSAVDEAITRILAEQARLAAEGQQ